MRFAAIADVHGNDLALEAVIADIRAQGISDIVNLGDMASGPLDARRTMDMLMALDATHLDWLRAVPATSVFRDRIFLCHATPANDEVYWLDTVLPDGAVALSPRERIETLAEGVSQSLILCAHTHLARAVRLTDGRLIVNPGSVGSPGYRDTHPYP